MSSHRVKAFTIMEMTVAMLIAAVVIGITYTAYLIVIGSYNSFTKKNNEMAVAIRLDELLRRDFSHADIILKQQDALVFKTNGQITSYEISPNFIVRTHIVTDTFQVRTELLIAGFEGLPVNNDIETDTMKSRIDEASFNLLYENEKIPYHYYKQYSSVNLMQAPNAIN